MTYPVIPVRWRPDQPMVTGTYDLPVDHPLAGTLCPVCKEPIDGGGRFALVALGPDPEDDHAIARHEAGRWYTADGVMAHARCGETLDAGEEEPTPIPQLANHLD